MSLNNVDKNISINNSMKDFGSLSSYLNISESDGEVTDHNSLDMTYFGKLLQRYIKYYGLNDHHIELFNNWIIETSIYDIQSRYLTLPDNHYITYENLKILPPRYSRDGKILPLTPSMARKLDITYGNDWQVDLVLRQGSHDHNGKIIDQVHNICIGNVPCMLKSYNCILRGRSYDELLMYGEDPLETGGYFIVAGAEKVVLLQEKISVNHIFIMLDKNKGTPIIRITINTIRGTTLVDLILDKRHKSIIKIRFPSMRRVNEDAENKKTKKKNPIRSINVLIIFRVYGISDIKTIKNYIKRFLPREHRHKSMLNLSNTINQFESVTNDMENIINKLNRNDIVDDQDRYNEIIRVFNNDLFPHLNSLPGPNNETQEQYFERIKEAKLNLLSIMIARILEFQAGYRNVDNRDSWSKKRIEGASRMMKQLLRNAWKKINNSIQAKATKGLVKDLRGVVDEIRKDDTITKSFRDSFVTSNWGVEGTQTKTNIAQSLVRRNIIATLSHINTVDVEISRTDKQLSIRAVQNDQYGFICPVLTPDNSSCGLIKNLSITTRVSLDRDDTLIIRKLIGDPEFGFPARVWLDPNVKVPNPTKVLINGKFIGWTNGPETVKYLIQMRRSGEAFPDMSVIHDNDWIYIDMSPSRPIRPLLVVDEDQQLMIDKLNLREASIPELIQQGVIEYLSPWEQERIKLASSPSEIMNRLSKIKDAEQEVKKYYLEYNRINNGQTVIIDDNGTSRPKTIQEAISSFESSKEYYTKMKNIRPYTHCEIHSLAILGLSAALIPWPNHNQAPRNTYQSSMCKQALGINHINYENRFENDKTKMLISPTRPIAGTEMNTFIGLDARPQGENVRVAFITYPFNEEDSFVVKKEFLDNIGFRIMRYLIYKTTVKQSEGFVDYLTVPALRPGEDPKKYEHIQMYENGNPSNGLPRIGSYIQNGQCIIAKIRKNTKNGDKVNDSIFMKYGDDGIVDKVQVNSDGKDITIIVRIRSMKVPEPGDKFAPRNAQKGTIGIIISDVDMPYDENGLSPDFIANPACIPSRMTVGYLMEVISSKYAVYKGKRINCTSFHNFDRDLIREGLREYGKSEFGSEVMRSGISGQKLENAIFSGPVFFQCLKHRVDEKIQARSQGKYQPINHQPLKGRSNRGGLRFGEMERDVAISYGGSALIQERLMYTSDAYPMVFCINCSTPAVNQVHSDGYRQCRNCLNDKDFGIQTIPYAFKLMTQLVAVLGINLRTNHMTIEEYKQKVLKNDGDVSSINNEDIDSSINIDDIESDNEEDNEINQEYDEANNVSESDYDFTNE